MYGECFAEKWVLAQNKGAIAEIATNRCGTARGNIAFIEEMTRNIFEDQVNVLGDAFVNAKLSIIENYADDVGYYGPAILYALLGDPASRLKFFETSTELDRNRGNVTHSYLLAQNYPNPFNLTTSIQYSVIGDQPLAYITLKIFNLLGQEVVTLVDEPKQPGYYSVKWDGRNNERRDVSSGVFFYRLSVEQGVWSETKKMALIR